MSKILKKYTIRLSGVYAFGSEDTVLEAENEVEALKLARELYVADDYVIIAIN